jgi:UTP--glucose-1-phosphate uridylyltransferase
MEIKKAVIPAAGIGTRFLPITKAQPKEMLPIIDKPVIHFVVEEAVKSGIKDIIIITGRGKQAVENYFDINPDLEKLLEKNGKSDLLAEMKNIENMANIHYVRQKEQRGLGHAIQCASGFVGNEAFAVLLGDSIVKSKIPCIKQLINLHKKFKCSVVGTEIVPKETVGRYGVIKGKEIEKNVFALDDLVEKPKPSDAPSNMAIMGRYILNPSIFEMIEKTKPGIGGEVQITDALRSLLDREKIYSTVIEGKRYDIGSKIDFIKTNIEFALERGEFREDVLRFLNTLLKA